MSNDISFSLICSVFFLELFVVLFRSREERLTGTDGHIFLGSCESQVGLEGGNDGGGRGGSA